ncbi:hypothetical protein BDV33DRAFT_202374 [Aspergillus novoparasiticus]|uniref:Agmatine deiminase n=1 Tax=Aspergillus novoparasiticus TaxID=986946 RepID=A0A5N6EX96_9EURO|nr:hypothetical protein BDV33DRAFT_202374 [Aspergillus novoparasiticus]
MTIRAKFYMPHEGHPYCQGKIIMAWPGPNNPNYENRQIARIKIELIAIAKTICHFQTVILLVHSTKVPEAERAFQDCGMYGIEIQVTDVSDLEFWMRDVAPTFVISEGSSRSVPHGIDFNFNGWVSRPETNPPRGNFDRSRRRRVGNGRRENVTSRVAIEKELRRLLGASKIIWLSGLKGYEVTDTHIDIWDRFVAPGKVVLNKPRSDNEVLRAAYDASKRILSQATDAKGRHFELFDIQEARLDGPISSDSNLCLSYVNYVVVNGAIIAP